MGTTTASENSGKKERRKRNDRKTEKEPEDPDRPVDCINSTTVIESIDVNGVQQRVLKKTYQLIDGSTKVITRIEGN